jgi:inner membrane protein
MDNATHTLTGLALSRAGLNRHVPHASFLLMLAANIPDIDMVTLFQGPLQNLEAHRGYTHSLIGLPFVSALPVLLTGAVFRTRLPWFAAWLISVVGVVSHLLIDWTTSYGMRLLLPFSSKWSYLDLFNLYDLPLLAVLLFCALAPMLSRLVSAEIGSKAGNGRGFAIFALVFFLLFGGFRAMMHSRALAQLNSRLYGDGHEGVVLRTAALPGAVNPLSWYGVVETEHAFHLYDVPAMSNFDPTSAQAFYKGSWSPAFEAISKVQPARYFLYFARFPYWQEQPASTKDNLRLVTVTDLRFGPPGESFFAVEALVNARNHVQAIAFGSREFKPVKSDLN